MLIIAYRFLYLPCQVRHLKGASYPLSAYLDTDRLKKFYPHWISYDEWFATVFMAQRPAPSLDNSSQRYIIPQSYCLELHEDWCTTGDKPLGDFYIQKEVYARFTYKLEETFTLLLGDESQTMYFHGYYRFFFGHEGQYPTVPFNPLHLTAVKRFVRDRFHGSQFIVYHWRSEGVADALMQPCARALSSASQRMAQVNPSNPRAMIMSDMPAPNNARLMWHTYEGGNGTADVVL